MKTTYYHVTCDKLNTPVRIALASDLHDNPYKPVVERLREEKPDMILIPGDLTDDSSIRQGASAALAFLRECALIAPTFYSPGNHEIRCYHGGNPFRHPIPIPIPDTYRQAVQKVGAIFLDNDYTVQNGFTVFGLSSGICKEKNLPDIRTVERFRRTEGEIRILLCHHPEYFFPYLQQLGMDLVVCGHAHGGHWRFFGRGIYAPGQGLFPRYTSGVIGDVCVISRGLGNHTSIPRIFNEPELVMITLGKTESYLQAE